MFGEYIQISKLNDFIFCPKSIYFHGIYEDKKEIHYHREPQVNGKIKHEAIDNGRYSSSKHILQGLEIFSEELGLLGKIDVYDEKKKELIERKAKIKEIYQGYLYQVYAQYFCLIEMGYDVNKIFFHSLEDNKRYAIKIPNQKIRNEFKRFLQKIRNFNITKEQVQGNKEKCKNCIYKELCH